MTLTRTVVAADTVFLVRESGSGGTPVLLLHGVPETSSCWDDVAPRLAQDRRVLAPDLPGLGGSTCTGPYDVRSVAAQVAALLDAEVDGPVDVVGHDWGGNVALGLAGLRPDLVRRLVVADCTYRQPPPVHRAVHVPLFALPALPELAFRLAGRRLVDLMLAIGWQSARTLDPERRTEYEAAYASRAQVSAMLGYYRAAARPYVLDRIPGRTARAALPDVATREVLVLWGALDPVLPISTGERIVRDLGPHARMVTVPGAGHFVLEEAPEVVAQVLADFLAD